MRLPQPLLDSPLFQFERLDDFERAIGEYSHVELLEIRRLASIGLPPIISESTLGTLIGVNPGLIWSFVNRPRKHYRQFYIAKGRHRRRIDAPRIALKIPQKWIGTQLAGRYNAPDHVFGFVPGRSHVGAARVHVGANWVLSLDIENFFPSTPQKLVAEALVSAGFNLSGAELIAALTCLEGGLAQGAPSSPIISNFCFAPWDKGLSTFASGKKVRLSRYADDIVISGDAAYPEGLKEQVCELLKSSPWRISESKTRVAFSPARLKVHGLLVHGREVRPTKGYRNKLRMFRHILSNRSNLDPKFVDKVRGHISYENSVGK